MAGKAKFIQPKGNENKQPSCLFLIQERSFSMFTCTYTRRVRSVICAQQRLSHRLHSPEKQ